MERLRQRIETTSSAMIDDRNLTSHTYHQGLAERIYEQLVEYAGLMEKWLQAMQDRG